MNRFLFTAAAAVCMLSFVSSTVHAQLAAKGQAAQPAASAASAPGRGPGYGPGAGAGMGPRGGGPATGAAPSPRGRWGESFTSGWSMMTPQERDEHRAQMRGAQSREECSRIAAEHRALMQKRAQERGVNMPGPRSDACRSFRR